MSHTNIEWATHSRNYYTWDCTRISPGCKNCYMFAMAAQYHKPVTGVPQWRDSVRKENIEPGAVYFVNSMSDTYHEAVPVAWLHRIHNEALLHPEATFLVLTKRIERAYYLAPTLAWPKNLWIGTSVENADYLWRLDYLLRIPAAGHFVSVGPMLGPVPGLADYLMPAVDQPLFLSTPTLRKGLGWVIVEAESGPDRVRREFKLDWARAVRDMCQAAGVRFMFKQGSHQLPGRNREMDGRTWDESPFHPPAPTDDNPYGMLPEHHALRRYFETHEPGVYAFDRMVCEMAIRDYAARIQQHETRIAEAQRVWPPRLAAISAKLKSNLTPVEKPHPRPLSQTERGEEPTIDDVQMAIRQKRLAEELVETRSTFFGIVSGAQAEIKRLRTEREAYLARLRMIAGQTVEKLAA